MKKSEGKTLGRPKGSLSKTKLTGKDEAIIMFLNKKVPVATMARILDVNRLTLSNYIRPKPCRYSLKIATPPVFNGLT